jgi:hypothetical protein
VCAESEDEVGEEEFRQSPAAIDYRFHLTAGTIVTLPSGQEGQGTRPERAGRAAELVSTEKMISQVTGPELDSRHPVSGRCIPLLTGLMAR